MVRFRALESSHDSRNSRSVQVGPVGPGTPVMPGYTFFLAQQGKPHLPKCRPGHRPSQRRTTRKEQAVKPPDAKHRSAANSLLLQSRVLDTCKDMPLATCHCVVTPSIVGSPGLRTALGAGSRRSPARSRVISGRGPDMCVVGVLPEAKRLRAWEPPSFRQPPPRHPCCDILAACLASKLKLPPPPPPLASPELTFVAPPRRHTHTYMPAHALTSTTVAILMCMQ